MVFIKKIVFDKKYLKISFYFLLVIIISISFEKLLGNINIVLEFLNSILTFVSSVLTPFIYGFFIAYFINVPVRWLEKRAFSKIKPVDSRPKIKRVLAVLAAYIILIGFLIWNISYLLPEIIDSIKSLVLSLQRYVWEINSGNNTYAFSSESLNAFFKSFNETFSTNYSLSDVVNFVIEPITKTLSELPNILNTIFQSTVNVAYTLLNFVLGLVMAFYMLCEKENMARIAKKSVYVFFNRRSADKIVKTAKSSNAVFEKFLIGKAVDALIIGVLFFVSGAVIGLPFLLLSSLIIGVANMIPYFGPLFGAIPVLFITLLVNPMQALWALIVIFVLQQLDGLIIAPKILGDSTGVKPMGVIFSIIVGGALFGVFGMLFGVPVFAVLKTMLKSLMDKRYNEKYVALESQEQTPPM